MAHFYGSIKGQAKTQATRRGSEKGGMDAHIRGWDVGCRVQAECVDGKDTFTVYRTNGSNNPSNCGYRIAQFNADEIAG